MLKCSVLSHFADLNLFVMKIDLLPRESPHVSGKSVVSRHSPPLKRSRHFGYLV